MALTHSLVEQAIKSDSDTLLTELMRIELKRLRDRRRYYQKKESQMLGSDVDYDKFVKLRAQENLIEEQINTIVTARKNLKESHAKSTSKLLDLSKQQKVLTPKSKAFSQYAQSFDDNINGTFNSMFGKGQFILSDDEIAKYDAVFNKYGIGISDTIKRNIAKRYKHWSSDIAYQIFNEWLTKAETVTENVTEDDKKVFNEYLNIVRGRL